MLFRSIVIINTTQQPILTNLQNRELRKKVYMASIHRADGTNPDFNTFPIVTEIAKLRAEKGKLMEYDNYADYSLEKTMAKNSKNVDDFLKQLIKEYAPIATTRCLSQPVYFMHQAKPMQEQTEVIRPALVMLLAKASSAAMGLPAIMHIKIPAAISTIRDSWRFSSK